MREEPDGDFEARVQRVGSLAPPVAPEVAARFQVEDRNRTDDAEAMVRLEGARGALADVEIPPAATVRRPRGSVSVDNDTVGRYKGEIALQRRDLPAEARSTWWGTSCRRTSTWSTGSDPGSGYGCGRAGAGRRGWSRTPVRTEISHAFEGM